MRGRLRYSGTSYKNKPTLTVTEDEFDKVMAVNVKSVYWSIPAVVPALQERGGGAIINIASIGAMRPRPGLVWYDDRWIRSTYWLSLLQVQCKQSCCRQREDEIAQFYPLC